MKIELNKPAFGLPNRSPVALADQVGIALVAQPVSRIQIKGGCTGIWEVIGVDRLYGHYTGYRRAMDAAKAAAAAIVENGGAADIAFDPNGLMQTMEFRPGTAPIVR